MLPAGESGLTTKWEGPYVVKKVLGPLTYLIDKPTKGKEGRRVHRNHLKRYIHHVTLAHVITAEDDDRSTDRLILGPALPHQGQQPDADQWNRAVDIKALTLDQRRDLLQLLTSYEDTFSDFPGEADLPLIQVKRVKPLQGPTQCHWPTGTRTKEYGGPGSHFPHLQVPSYLCS